MADSAKKPGVVEEPEDDAAPKPAAKPRRRPWLVAAYGTLWLLLAWPAAYGGYWMALNKPVPAQPEPPVAETQEPVDEALTFVQGLDLATERGLNFGEGYAPGDPVHNAVLTRRLPHVSARDTFVRLEPEDRQMHARIVELRPLPETTIERPSTDVARVLEYRGGLGGFESVRPAALEPRDLGHGEGTYLSPASEEPREILPGPMERPISSTGMPPADYNLSQSR